MNDILINSVGQSLLAVGLYTVAFESMVLTFRAQMHGYLVKNEPDALLEFEKSLGTSNNTLKFCEPRVVSLGILEKSEVNSLVAMRRRRNAMAHESYNEVCNLSVEDVTKDVVFMFKVSRKLERWNQISREGNTVGAPSFYIAPSIFGLYLQVAQDLARTKLYVKSDPKNA